MPSTLRARGPRTPTFSQPGGSDGSFGGGQELYGDCARWKLYFFVQGALPLPSRPCPLAA